MRIGFSATYGFQSILDAVNFAADNGFNAVEINLNIPEFYPCKYNIQERQKLKTILEEKGIHISFHAPEDINLSSGQKELGIASLNILKECIDFAYDLGGERFTFHLGDSVNFTMVDRSLRMEDYYSDNFKNIIRYNLSNIIEYNRDRIILCAENAGYLSNAKIYAIESFLGKGLYLTWDLGHSIIDKNQMEFIMRNLQFVRNVHVHDVLEGKDHRIIGTGQVDIPKYLSLLNGMDAMYIIEVRPHSAAVESLINLKAYRDSSV